MASETQTLVERAASARERAAAGNLTTMEAVELVQEAAEGLIERLASAAAELDRLAASLETASEQVRTQAALLAEKNKRIAELEAAVGDAAETMEWLTENHPDALGWVGHDKPGGPWPESKELAANYRALLPGGSDD